MERIQNFKSFSTLKTQLREEAENQQKEVSRGEAAASFNELLKKYNVTKASELTEDQLKAFTAELFDLNEEETEVAEGRAFIFAASKAKKEGKKEFEWNGKKYPITLKESETEEAKETEEVNEGKRERNSVVNAWKKSGVKELNAIAKVYADAMEDANFHKEIVTSKAIGSASKAKGQGQVYSDISNAAKWDGYAIANGTVDYLKEIGENDAADKLLNAITKFDLNESVNLNSLEQIIEEGTRGQFGKIYKSGEIASVYTHYDSYPEHMLPVIKKGYKSGSDVDAVITKGDNSGLEADINKIKFYNDKNSMTPLKGSIKNLKKYINDADANGAEYAYLYDERDGKWYMIDLYGDRDLKPAFESVVTEAKYDKKKLLKAIENSDDATILVKGKEYIIYNPNNGNDDNAAMWGDKTIVALDPDGDEVEFKYSDIERFSESVVSEAEGDFAGWIAFFNGKKVEITKDEAKDLWSAKKLAIAKMKVPKSKESMVAIAPAVEEMFVAEAEVDIHDEVSGVIADLYSKLNDLAEQTTDSAWRKAIETIIRSVETVEKNIDKAAYKLGVVPTHESEEMDEAYDGKLADFKYDLEMAVEDMGISPIAIKKVSKKGKGFEVRMSSYMSLRGTWEKLANAIGAELVDFQKGSINVGVFESVKEGNAFSAARAEAIAKGEKEFEVDGKKYPVTDVDAEDKKNAEEFVGEGAKEEQSAMELYVKLVDPRTGKYSQPEMEKMNLDELEEVVTGEGFRGKQAKEIAKELLKVARG